ncbi:hypothetical protein PPERSA_03594 [Pseudocohnilembus persalinus]|uniref:LITAF domain-containing protein n=1 Tax=Pseudocohnilembus persalinus TaxID=266149 RepID=A0A0V0QQ03_PSEPJ|nr:hypothetical protein PPERSA_03594 [Pseudocohnilembus persalinus]|eukprot:KRX04354.1 hypothetical protein PPERSA_03594 [Pseudocohnilembus persalinus]
MDNNNQYNQLNTTQGDSSQQPQIAQGQPVFNQPPQQQNFNQQPQQQGYIPPSPQQQQFNSPPQQQVITIQSNSTSWRCPACQQQSGFVEETDCCGLFCVLWWCFVPFGICIYPLCCQEAHKKVRKCINCQNNTVIQEDRCCP